MSFVSFRDSCNESFQIDERHGLSALHSTEVDSGFEIVPESICAVDSLKAHWRLPEPDLDPYMSSIVLFLCLTVSHTHCLYPLYFSEAHTHTHARSFSLCCRSLSDKISRMLCAIEHNMSKILISKILLHRNLWHIVFNRKCIYTCMNMYLEWYTYTYVYTYTLIYIYIYMYICIRMKMYIYIYIYANESQNHLHACHRDTKIRYKTFQTPLPLLRWHTNRAGKSVTGRTLARTSAGTNLYTDTHRVAYSASVMPGSTESLLPGAWTKYVF